MKQKYMSILVIFNILIFSVITVFSGIMLFHASYAVPTEWDGTMGTGFAGGNGSSSRPYLISSGKELAYFIKKCNETASYRSKYYKLTADITLNDGYFDFKSTSEYYYYKNGLKYYINKNKYYDTNVYTSQHEVGSFNQLPVSKFTFTGSFDGNDKAIYGMFYYSEEDDDCFGLFYKTAVNNGSSAEIKGLKVINSSIIATNSTYVGLIGSLSSTNVTSVLYSGLIENLTNENASSAGFIGHINISNYNINLNLVSISGYVMGNNAGGLIGSYSGNGSSTNSNIYISLMRCCNYATVVGGVISSLSGIKTRNSGGIIGIIDSNYKASFYFSNVFNLGIVNSYYGGCSGGFIGYVYSFKVITFRNCFNDSKSNLTGQFVGCFDDYDSTKIDFSGKNYYTKNSKVIGNYSSIVSGFTYNSQLTKSVLVGMGYKEYPVDGWYYKDDRPYIYFDDKDAPNINLSINISGESKSWSVSENKRNIWTLYDNDDQKTVNYTSSDSNKIVLVEYRVVPNNFLKDHLNINFDDAIISNSNSSSIDISNNNCSIVYVRVTDIYGNVSYAYTDLIMSGYKTTEYVDSEADDDIVVDKAVMSDSVLNINFKQQFSVENNAYISLTETMRQYLCLVNKLPVGTKLSLYDSRDKNTYILYIDENTDYLNENTYYVIDLSNFHSVLDSSTFYNNNLDSFATSTSFDCDITISFDFPDSFNGDRDYYFSNSFLHSVSDSNASRLNSKIIDTIVTSIDYYYDTEYYLNPNFSDINIQTNSLSNSYTLNFDVRKKVPITSIDGHDYIIRSKRNGYKNFKLYVQLVNPNNRNLSPLVGANFKYTLISNGVSKVFNNKSNSVAMADFVINNWNYTGHTSDDDEYTYNFDVKVDLVGNNFKNILPNNDYKLKFWILPSDDYATIDPEMVPVTIDSPKVFDGYSFRSSIDRNDRIFDHETGKNLNNNNYITYNYSYNLYSGNSQFLQYRFLKQNNNNVYTSVNPSTVLQPNSYSSLYWNYFKLNTNACLAGTTGCYERLMFKNNIPEGSYSVEVYLMRGDTAISQDYFNFIVK